jgi:hypothetical protein
MARRWFGVMAAILVGTSGVIAGVVSCEDQVLRPESYWNGADGSGGFASGRAFFKNSYTEYPGGFGYWEGFACSNRTSRTLEGLAGQYTAICGKGQAGSGNYAVGYVGWASVPTVVLDSPSLVKGCYVTNVCYAYYAMAKGDAYSKKFGGDAGRDPDWFLLTVAGTDGQGKRTGEVHFFLADYRPQDGKEDFLVDDWTWVDLRSLGQVKTLEFTLSSSDTGASGMNTPGYFALDTLVLQGLAEPDAGISAYVDPGTSRPAGPKEPGAVFHPAFRGWATQVVRYDPSDDQWVAPGRVNDPNKALGPATGDPLDVVSLGELDPDEIASHKAPGSIILAFGDPNDPHDPRHIRNGPGLDLAVFENGFASLVDTLAGSVSGQMLAELAFVEVSTNGRDFARLPSLSLTDRPTGAYGTIDVGKVHNLAGRHPNGYGLSSGTAFDLQDLEGDPLVVSGLVDLQDIRFVRIVDIPGSGDFPDQATEFIDPCSAPAWACYDHCHAIFDQWPTWGSGGFDLEAVGVLHPQRYAADINLDGVVDLLDFAVLASCWKTRFGQPGWVARADLSADLAIDCKDLAVMAGQWLEMEPWRGSRD